MDAYGRTTSKVSDHSPGESTLIHSGSGPDTVCLDQDEGLQRDGFDDKDDLESELSGPEHFERERDEGDEGDLTEVAAPAPVDRTRARGDSLEREEEEAGRRKSHSNNADRGDEFLSELAAPAPISHHRANRDEEKSGESTPPSIDSRDDQSVMNEAASKPHSRSRLATELYTHSYLIFFSLLGTLARLGIESITSYPNAPVLSSVLWANLGGSFFLGFLTEDRRLFREEWGMDSEDWSFHASNIDFEGKDKEKIQQLHAAHGKVKKTIPLFIGLAVGFCGSFTSFSSFIRDAFLASLNRLPDPPLGRTFGSNPTPLRNGGYNFEATIAVLIIHVAVSLGALQVGGTVASSLDRFLPTLPFKFVRRALDPLMAVVGCGCWLGAVCLSIWPAETDWRGRVTFALVLAPPGCLLRFYASKHLNSRLPSFPVGTFCVNVFGTVILGLCYDLQHSDAGASIVGCQVLEGVIEGFCGCVTTVSTWALELDTLRRKHGYIYALASMSMAIGALVVIMGTLEWTKGFTVPVC